MAFVLPPPTSSSSSSNSTPEYKKSRKEFLDLVCSLQLEVSDFIENSMEEKEFMAPGAVFVPRLPIFFVKGFNVLQSMRHQVKQGFTYPSLSMMPQFMNLTILTQYGPDFQGTPYQLESGFLREAAHLNDTLDMELKRYFSDIAKYIKDFRAVKQEFPNVPAAVQLMTVYFLNKYQVKDLNKQLDAHLREAIGHDYPDNYLAKFTKF